MMNDIGLLLLCTFYNFFLAPNLPTFIVHHFLLLLLRAPYSINQKIRGGQKVNTSNIRLQRKECHIYITINDLFSNNYCSAPYEHLRVQL